MSQPRLSEDLGRLAHEVYFAPENALYPGWDALHPAQQDGWRRAAKALYDAGFQAGADSAIGACDEG